MTDRNAPTLPPPQVNTVVDTANYLAEVVRQRNAAWAEAAELRLRIEDIWRDGFKRGKLDSEMLCLTYAKYQKTLRCSGMAGAMAIARHDAGLTLAFRISELPTPGREPATDGCSECGDDTENPR